MPSKFIFYDEQNELELHVDPQKKNRLQITVAPRDIDAGGGGYINLDVADIDKLIESLQQKKAEIRE